MNYRKIWEKHNNKKIPEGYEIHHIDGNRKNNDPSNLQCVSIEEHLRIHNEQGDYAAVQSILMRMEQTEEVKLKIRQAASMHQKKLLKEGRHNFPFGKARSELSKKIMSKRLASGQGAFLGIDDPVANGRKGGMRAAELKAGFLDVNSNHHGGKLTAGTKWWTDVNGNRKRSKERPGPEWKRGMKYES